MRLQIKVESRYTLLISAVFQCMVIADQGNQIFPELKVYTSIFYNILICSRLRFKIISTSYLDMLQ